MRLLWMPSAVGETWFGFFAIRLTLSRPVGLFVGRRRLGFSAGIRQVMVSGGARDVTVGDVACGVIIQDG